MLHYTLKTIFVDYIVTLFIYTDPGHVRRLQREGCSPIERRDTWRGPSSNIAHAKVAP